MKRILVSTAIVVIGALVLWGGVLAPHHSAALRTKPHFAPFLFAGPVAAGAFVYQALLQTWLGREQPGPFAWILWTMVFPIGLVAAALAMARFVLPSLLALLTP